MRKYAGVSAGISSLTYVYHREKGLAQRFSRRIEYSCLWHRSNKWTNCAAFTLLRQSSFPHSLALRFVSCRSTTCSKFYIWNIKCLSKLFLRHIIYTCFCNRGLSSAKVFLFNFTLLSLAFLKNWCICICVASSPAQALNVIATLACSCCYNLTWTFLPGEI